MSRLLVISVTTMFALIISQAFSYSQPPKWERYQKWCSNGKKRWYSVDVFLGHFGTNAEVSGCRSIQSPKCP